MLLSVRWKVLLCPIWNCFCFKPNSCWGHDSKVKSVTFAFKLCFSHLRILEFYVRGRSREICLILHFYRSALNYDYCFICSSAYVRRLVIFGWPFVCIVMKTWVLVVGYWLLLEWTSLLPGKCLASEVYIDCIAIRSLHCIASGTGSMNYLRFIARVTEDCCHRKPAKKVVLNSVSLKCQFLSLNSVRCNRFYQGSAKWTESRLCD